MALPSTSRLFEGQLGAGKGEPLLSARCPLWRCRTRCGPPHCRRRTRCRATTKTRSRRRADRLP
eukprot:5470930-Prorocentrum_lima.AAC.1